MQDSNQNTRANEGYNDPPDYTTPCAYTKQAEQPATEECADDTNNYITDDAIPTSTHHYARKEASDQTNNDPPYNGCGADIRQHQSCQRHSKTLLRMSPPINASVNVPLHRPGAITWMKLAKFFTLQGGLEGGGLEASSPSIKMSS